jgi:hypothetical protein
MDTQLIFEELKGELGDAAARSLTRTFAAVYEELRDGVTREDFRILRESMEANVSRLDRSLTRLAEAQTRTEVKLTELADGQKQLFEAQTRTDGKLAELAEAQTRTEAKLTELADGQKHLFEAQTRTDGKLAELAEAQTRSEASINRLDTAMVRLAEAQTDMATALQRLTIRTDSVVGRTLELQFRDRIASYLGLFMRRCRLVDTSQLIDALEPHLDRRELADVIRADAIASGVIDGRPSHVVVEVSAAADVDDIQRASRRAGLLRRAGLDAVPIIACEVISPESRAYAKQAEVLVWLDGRMMESGEAA